MQLFVEKLSKTAESDRDRETLSKTAESDRDTETDTQRQRERELKHCELYFTRIIVQVQLNPNNQSLPCC